jgi:hypothetical protein
MGEAEVETFEEFQWFGAGVCRGMLSGVMVGLRASRQWGLDDARTQSWQPGETSATGRVGGDSGGMWRMHGHCPSSPWNIQFPVQVEGGNMELVDALKTMLIASLWFSWIALAIALLPTLFVSIAAETHGWQYAIAGLLGGVVGESCGTASLFLSFWLSCRNQAQCNTAQGDMGLIVVVPVGTIIGCVLALSWTRITLRIPEDSPWSSVSRYTGPSRVQNWAYAVALQVGFWLLATWVSALLMA